MSDQIADSSCRQKITIALAPIQEMRKGAAERQFAAQLGAVLWIKSAAWIHNVNPPSVGTGSSDNCAENMAVTFIVALHRTLNLIPRQKEVAHVHLF